MPGLAVKRTWKTQESMPESVSPVKVWTSLFVKLEEKLDDETGQCKKKAGN